MWWAMREYALHSPTFVQQYTRNTPATPATPLPTPKKNHSTQSTESSQASGCEKAQGEDTKAR